MQIELLVRGGVERDVGLHALLDAPDQFPNYVLSTDSRPKTRELYTISLPAVKSRNQIIKRARMRLLCGRNHGGRIAPTPAAPGGLNTRYACCEAIWFLDEQNEKPCKARSQEKDDT